MDMLQFFQEKLRIKQGFAQLLDDIGINKKVFMDENDLENLQNEEESAENDENLAGGG